MTKLCTVWKNWKKKIDPKKRKIPHLASTSFFSYRFPSIPEEEKWADAWQLYSRLIATEHRASVVHKFSSFLDERVPRRWWTSVRLRGEREEGGGYDI